MTPSISGEGEKNESRDHSAAAPAARRERVAGTAAKISANVGQDAAWKDIKYGFHQSK